MRRIARDWLLWTAVAFGVLGFVQGGLLGILVDMVVYVIPVYIVREYVRGRRERRERERQ